MLVAKEHLSELKSQDLPCKAIFSLFFDFTIKGLNLKSSNKC